MEWVDWRIAGLEVVSYLFHLVKLSTGPRGNLVFAFHLLRSNFAAPDPKPNITAIKSPRFSINCF